MPVPNDRAASKSTAYPGRSSRGRRVFWVEAAVRLAMCLRY